MSKANPSEQVPKIANFVVAYLDSGVRLRHVIRTTFDTIDGLNNEFVGPRGGVWNFNTANLKDPKRTEKILTSFPYISKSARNHLKSIADGIDLPDGVKLQCDHVIPRKCLEDMLHEQHRRTPMTGTDVLEFHDNYFRRCILTGNEHSQLLNDKMPNGWTPEMGPFSRYEKAKFHWANEWK
jgi:hypothetical protein